MKKIFFLGIAMFVVLSVSSQSITNGLVGYWPFDGNADDVSQNEQPESVYGASLNINRDSEPNSAYQFDGIDDYILSLNNGVTGVQAFSISLWFNTTDASNSNNALLHWGSGNGSNNQVHVGIENGVVWSRHSGPKASAGINYNDGNWHHLVILKPTSGTIEDLSIFVDGIELTTSTSGSGVLNIESDYKVNIGRSEYVGWNYSGLLDEVMIFNRVLEPEEIAFLFADEISNYWTLDGVNLYPSLFNLNVGIGTSTIPESYRLAVKGKAIMEEINVQLSENWPDFVFYDDYNLRKLKEVEQYIEENGHLPEIPSEVDVTENGINLGEMNAKLLQKIEELTLYLIEQSKEIKELKALTQQQQTEIELLKNK